MYVYILYLYMYIFIDLIYTYIHIHLYYYYVYCIHRYCIHEFIFFVFFFFSLNLVLNLSHRTKCVARRLFFDVSLTITIVFTRLLCSFNIHPGKSAENVYSIKYENEKNFRNSRQNSKKFVPYIFAP